MTILTLTETAISPLSDPTDVLLLPQSSEMFTHSGQASVRVYAGGVRRIISTPGDAEVVTLSFARLDRAEYDVLLSLLNVPILFRDQRGRNTSGVFFNLSGEEQRLHPGRVMNVALTVENITASEVV